MVERQDLAWLLMRGMMRFEVRGGLGKNGSGCDFW
jgi:hypothetical protein